MKTLRKGDRGEEVKVLQQALGVPVDGIFGNRTELAVIAWQLEHGLKSDGVVGEKTWGTIPTPDTHPQPLPKGGETVSGVGVLKKSKRVINLIVVHCTATREGQEVTVKEIDSWHRARGFAGIGYHYVVHLDGQVECGRDVDKAGAHTRGYNAHSIGISYVGGVEKDGKTPKDTRTEAQKKALTGLLKELRRMYPGAAIRGHRDFANKACPSFDATMEYKGV